MSKVHLVLPLPNHKPLVEAFIKEGKEANIEFNGSSRVEDLAYEDWLAKVYQHTFNRDVGEGRVPATTFFAFVEERLVGMINIRHQLNPFLLQVGGHIGYMVRPSEQRKGYAKQMLKNAVEYLQQAFSIKEILVTCSPENIGSKKTILANGGVYERTTFHPDFGKVDQYWIKR